MRSDQKDASKPLTLELYRFPVDIQDVQVTWPRSFLTVVTPSPLLHVSISAVPSSTDGEDAVTVLTAHAEPPAVSAFVVMRDPWQTMQFRLWPERIAKAEVGPFRPDPEWEEEIQAAAIAAAGADADADADAEEGEVIQILEDDSENDMVVNELAPPPAPPVPLEDTTFRFQLYGPFFEGILHTYPGPPDPAVCLLRMLPGVTRPLLVGIRADDRRATPALCKLWAYADLIAPPAPNPRWPEDKERRAAGRAERGWIDAAIKSRESPAAVAQVALPRSIRERFMRGLVAIEWDDRSMSLCGVCVDEPNMIYLFQFAPTPSESESEYFHRFIVLVNSSCHFVLRCMMLQITMDIAFLYPSRMWMNICVRYPRRLPIPPPGPNDDVASPLEESSIGRRGAQLHSTNEL